jgi:oleate hydratase
MRPYGVRDGIDDLWPMAACTGREIMTEVLGHLRAETTPAEKASQLLDHAACIPCLMPFITSQFLPRERGDRPDVLPKGSMNLAFTGQFCELPHDVVFTDEYSIRSAQTAVYRLLGIDRLSGQG